jgi:2-methylcitrate dehydratase PrpD
MIDAQFSVPFNVAPGFARKPVSFVDLTPAAFADPAIIGLMNRVTCRVDLELDAQYPAAWPARVDVIFSDGQTLEAATRYAKGNPLSLDEIITKRPGIVDDNVDDALPDFIPHIETKPDFSELTRILRQVILPD